MVCHVQVQIYPSKYFQYFKKHKLGCEAVRHSVQLIKSLLETNQGTWIESRWQRKEIDGAGVKTSLT